MNLADIATRIGNFRCNHVAECRCRADFATAEITRLFEAKREEYAQFVEGVAYRAEFGGVETQKKITSYIAGLLRDAIKPELPTGEECPIHLKSCPYGERRRCAEMVAAITACMRRADTVFEAVGGSSRHFVRECLLPEFRAAGLTVIRTEAPKP